MLSVGCTVPRAGFSKTKCKEKAENQQSFLCFLTADSIWQAASHSHQHAFPTTMDYTFKRTAKISPSLFHTATRKVTNTGAMGSLEKGSSDDHKDTAWVPKTCLHEHLTQITPRNHDHGLKYPCARAWHVGTDLSMCSSEILWCPLLPFEVTPRHHASLKNWALNDSQEAWSPSCFLLELGPADLTKGTGPI